MESKISQVGVPAGQVFCVNVLAALVPVDKRLEVIALSFWTPDNDSDFWRVCLVRLSGLLVVHLITVIQIVLAHSGIQLLSLELHD